MTGQLDDFRLDNIYKMVAYIYHEKNEKRTIEATFAHFVEVCGLLAEYVQITAENSEKAIEMLCKALGWYFPLLAKARVKSTEQLVFRKFPRVCPYCRHSPHIPSACKIAGSGEEEVHPAKLNKLYNSNWPNRPGPMNEWMDMFQEIYPRAPGKSLQSITKLLEELGELAEAVRVLEYYPNYFLSEMADIFSYLMGIGNEIDLSCKSGNLARSSFSLQEEFVKWYPGHCKRCFSEICVCPHFPKGTVGRIAKEIPISDGEHLFSSARSIYNDGSAQCIKLNELLRIKSG